MTPVELILQIQVVALSGYAAVFRVPMPLRPPIIVPCECTDHDLRDPQPHLKPRLALSRSFCVFS